MSGWPRIRSATAPADEVLGPNTPGQRPGWTLNGGSLTFSPDGTKLFVNTAPKREPISTAPPGPGRADDFQLDLWHWKDERLQPMQKLQATTDQNEDVFGRRASRLEAVPPAVGRRDVPSANRPRPATGHSASDDRKYRLATGYGLPLTDYTAVNVRTGEKKSLVERLRRILDADAEPLADRQAPSRVRRQGLVRPSPSPDGKKTNLTGKLKEKFFDEQDDHPGTPPAGWSTAVDDRRQVRARQRPLRHLEARGRRFIGREPDQDRPRAADSLHDPPRAARGRRRRAGPRRRSVEAAPARRGEPAHPRHRLLSARTGSGGAEVAHHGCSPLRATDEGEERGRLSCSRCRRSTTTPTTSPRTRTSTN